MILRGSTIQGPAGPTVPAGCYQNFYQIFYQKWTTFDKNYQKDNLWEVFYWFVPLINLINY